MKSGWVCQDGCVGTTNMADCSYRTIGDVIQGAVYYPSKTPEPCLKPEGSDKAKDLIVDPRG